MAKTKTIIGTAVILCVGTPLVLQHRQKESLQQENRALQAEFASKETEMQEREGEILRLKSELGQLPELRSEIARLRAELSEVRRMSSAASNSKAAPPVVKDEASATDRGPVTEADVAEFMGKSPAEQGAILGSLRARGFGQTRGNALETTRTAELAMKVRGNLEEIESRPADYAAFQAEFIKSVVDLQDPAKLDQIRTLLQNTYQQAVENGLHAQGRPQDKQNLVEWGLRRDALDRPATRAVQALLTEEERARFDLKFLGVMGIDLGTGDGGWHRFKNESGGYIFPSEGDRP